MDRMQQRRYFQDLYEEMDSNTRRLSKSLRISEERVKQWEEGKRILEYSEIKMLEALVEEYWSGKMEELDLQSKMEQFCKVARLSEVQLARIMGLYSVNQLYEIYRKKTLYHVRHFALLKREQMQSGKQGKLLENHFEMLNYTALKK